MNVNIDAVPPTVSCYEDAAANASEDLTSEVAVMLLQHTKDSRETNRLDSRLEQEHLKQMQRNQVAEMRAQAKHIRDAATTRGIAGMVSGAYTIGGAVATASKSDDTATALNGYGKFYEGMSELGAAKSDEAAKNAEANATEFSHKAGESNLRLDDLREQRAHLRDVQRDALEYLKSIQSTEAQTDLALATWRA